MIKQLLIIAALLTSALNGQTVIANLSEKYVTSTVYQFGSTYKYEYVFDSKIDNKKVEQITIDLCDINVYDIKGDDKFDFELCKGYLSIEDIKPKGEYFVFSFYSKNFPDIFKSKIETSKNEYVFDVYAPGCNIPEPSVLSLLFIGLLINKRRR